MNQLFPIKVECYAGYKAGETPLNFTLNSMKFEIVEISDRWYQGETSPDFPPANYFKVKSRDGKNFLINHQLNSDEWFLLVKGESIHL